jgi:hypothetical protein
VRTGRHSPAIAWPLIPIAFAAALLAGCHDVDEYGAQAGSAVYKIRVEDLAVESSIDGFEGASDILSTGSTDFLVACRTGLLYRVGSEGMELDGVYSMGPQFASGYGSMVQTSYSSIYIIGAFGTILEINPSTCVVMDEFHAGPAPAGISRSASGNSIYVIDGLDSGLREVSTLDNTVTREMELPSAATTVTPFLESPATQIAISGSIPAAYAISEENLYAQEMGLPTVASDVAAFADTSIFCAVMTGDGYSGGAAFLMEGYPLPERSQTIPLNGRPESVCASPVQHRFYVASSLGDGTTRIYEIDGLFSWEILRTLDVPGWVLDITTHAAGEYLLVLTSD